jgi:hypothetical protein
LTPASVPTTSSSPRYQLPLNQYSTRASAGSFSRAVFDRLSSKPGIIAVGITNHLPTSSFSGTTAYTIEGESADTWKLRFAGFAVTYGDYFRAMRIPLLDGRYFTTDDRSSIDALRAI